ncbi:MAG: hypothetical protein WDO68_10615 [Gammaproteobacteria bacterium]
MKRFAAVFLAFMAFSVAGSAIASDTARRALTVDDLDRIRTVVDPALSPDGQWVAYSVRTTDVSKDKRVWHIWMTSWDGRQSTQVTQSPETEHSPGFGPDGHFLSFLSARGERDGPDALWLLDRAGGDARQVTHLQRRRDGLRLVAGRQEARARGARRSAARQRRGR